MAVRLKASTVSDRIIHPVEVSTATADNIDEQLKEALNQSQTGAQNMNATTTSENIFENTLEKSEITNKEDLFGVFYKINQLKQTKSTSVDDSILTPEEKKANEKNVRDAFMRGEFSFITNAEHTKKKVKDAILNEIGKSIDRYLDEIIKDKTIEGLTEKDIDSVCLEITKEIKSSI